MATQNPVAPATGAVLRTGLLWAFIGVLLFSLSVPMTKVAIGRFDPFFTAAGRAVMAGSLALVVLGIRRVPFPDRRFLKPLLFTVLGAVFGWPILIALALQRTTSAHVAVIAAFMPLTLVWSAWWLGETVAAGTVVAALVVIACVGWPQRSRSNPVLAPEE
jgi:drug/metabolite transporter (DMT)-like permease